MPYQYKREPLSDDEVNRHTNACETFEEKFVIWKSFTLNLGIGLWAHFGNHRLPCDMVFMLPLPIRNHQLWTP